MSRKPKKVTESRDTKFQLAREIAFWLTVDLRPFGWMSNNGLQHFLKQFGVINEEFEMPNPSMIHREALDEAYNYVDSRVKQLLAESDADYNLSIECFTDNYRQVQHLSCTVHWIDDSWNIKQINLGTVFIDVVESNLDLVYKIILEKLKEFGINRLFCVVTDTDQKLVEAMSALSLERLPCMAGTISELVIKGLLFPDEKLLDTLLPLQELLTKLRHMHKEVAFKLDTLDKSWSETPKSAENLRDFMESCSKLDSMLEAEQRVGNGTDGALTINNWITSWFICDHFLKYTELLEELPFKEPLSQQDYKYCTILRDVLGDLLQSTEILTGAKYSSLSSCLLFRSELVDRIEKMVPIAEDVSLDPLKKIVVDHLANGVVARFVINEATVCSAVVDPAMKDLGVIDQYLSVVTLSKHEFIKSMLTKHELLNKVEDAKSRMKSEDEISLQKEDKRDGQKHKKLRLQLLTKHSNTEALSSLDFEIKKYLLVSDVIEDPLTWWKANGDAFPYIQRLAKLYLPIPATAYPYERAFSVTGMVTTANRCALCPTLMKKMLFVHDNFETVMDR
ncbi:hypothetical protein CHUAL_014208 [Chamberlinius hualienensis]